MKKIKLSKENKENIYFLKMLLRKKTPMAWIFGDL
jgi:hypothetical protein